jgi:hypothetical protein
VRLSCRRRGEYLPPRFPERVCINQLSPDQNLTRIICHNDCTGALRAVWKLGFALALLLTATCTVAAQISPVVGDTLAARKDTTGPLLIPALPDSTVRPAGRAHLVRDTLAAKKDSTRLLLVTSASDSGTGRADTARANDSHPQDSPIDRGFFLRTGDGRAELRIIGSVRLNGVVDFNGLQSAQGFNTYAIPVGDANVHEVRFQMGGSQTRLALEATKKGDLGEIFVKVEFDFLGPSDAPRLRHAYGTFYQFLFGQTWSTFDDPTSIPLTVDLDGPNSAVSTRTAQIRYMGTIDPTLTWDAAIESPSVEATIPDSVGQQPSFQSFPDVIGRVRLSETWGHLQLAAVLRSISVRNPSGELDALAGYGLLLSGRIFLGGSRPQGILYQIVGGKGISRFITALSGEGLDLVYNPLSGSVELTASGGGYISYAREWAPSLLSYLTVGFIRIRNIDFFPDDAFRASQYVSGNLFWDPSPGMRIGVEYSWGRRVNRNGDYGDANRVSFIVRYDF